MLDAETWMSAHKAIELKFADKILYEEEKVEDESGGFIFDKLTVTNTLLHKLPNIRNKRQQAVANLGKEIHQKQVTENQIPVNQLQRRLELIKNWR